MMSDPQKHPKRKTIKITLEVDLVSLPREDWEDEMEEFGDGDAESMSDEWPIEELSKDSLDDIAASIEQATYDPEIFAGSMLYLKVAETTVVSCELVEEANG